MQILNKELCCGCSACASVCPHKCITMVADDGGFRYPVVDEKKCIACHLCEKVCPIQNQNIDMRESKAYAAHSMDDKIRATSSSGGIFTHLAEMVISAGGVVFGATMSEDCKSVHHIMIDSEKQITLLRGSKYLESCVDNAYVQVKERLEQKQYVLFSGTPCQVEGLRNFLKKDYKNLFTVDIICHGVPSPKAWEKYVEYRENCAGAPAQRTFFRHKKYGWKMYAVLFEFSNNTAYRKTLNNDLYMQIFLSDLCLRPSCYSCSFKKINRVSDITLGDFWGCESICPELDDDKGLSLVITHSEKGEQMLYALTNAIKMTEVELNLALKSNPAMVKSPCKPQKYDMFMQNDLQDVTAWAKYLKKYPFAKKLRLQARMFYNIIKHRKS